MPDETRDPRFGVMARAMVEQGPVTRGDYAAARRVLAGLRDNGFEVLSVKAQEAKGRQLEEARERATLYNRDMERVRDQRDELQARLDAADPIRKLVPELVEALEEAASSQVDQMRAYDRCKACGATWWGRGINPEPPRHTQSCPTLWWERLAARARKVMEADDEE
jgi:hypothetical protein